MRMTAEEFAERMGDPSCAKDAAIVSELASYDLSYRAPSAEERIEFVHLVLKKLLASDAYRPTEVNLAVWEKGWRENLELLKTADDPYAALRPKYFRGCKFLRYRGDLIVTDNLQIEPELLSAAKHHLFKKYLGGYDRICEIGAGACHNVLQLADMYPNAEVEAYDWTASSAMIADVLRERFGRKIRGGRFDMLDPAASGLSVRGAAVYTIHAMEQIGTRYGAFLDWICTQKPGIVVHHEPIWELYDPKNVYDALALAYSEKRDYLRGYLAALREKAAAGEVEIIEENRPYIGGVYHEASIVVWRPKA